jgi:hypothetical protein
MGILLLLHAGALICVMALPLQWWAILLIALVLFISLIYYVELMVRYRLKRSIRKFESINSQQWYLWQNDQQKLTVSLQRDSIVTRYLLILHFRGVHHKKRRSIVLFKDALPAPHFRQLRLLCLKGSKNET